MFSLIFAFPTSPSWLGRDETQQNTSPFWFLYGMVTKLPSVLSRDVLDGVCPAVLSLQQTLE